LAFAFEVPSVAQQGFRDPDHARQYRRLLIRNAMVIKDGIPITWRR
jgi:hypothetical protein